MSKKSGNGLELYEISPKGRNRLIIMEQVEDKIF